MPTLRTETESGRHHVLDVRLHSCACDSEVGVVGEVFLDVLPHSLGIMGAPLISGVKWDHGASKMSQPLFCRSTGLWYLIDTGKAIPSEIWRDRQVFVWSEIIQRELPIVNKKYSITNLFEVSKQTRSKALSEGPYVIMAIREVEVRVGCSDVVQ